MKYKEGDNVALTGDGYIYYFLKGYKPSQLECKVVGIRMYMDIPLYAVEFPEPMKKGKYNSTIDCHGMGKKGHCFYVRENFLK